MPPEGHQADFGVDGLGCASHGRHTCDELVKPGPHNALTICQQHLWAIVHPASVSEPCGRFVWGGRASSGAKCSHRAAADVAKGSGDPTNWVPSCAAGSGLCPVQSPNMGRGEGGGVRRPPLAPEAHGGSNRPSASSAPSLRRQPELEGRSKPLAPSRSPGGGRLDL
jgi:hypothetical protein